MKIGINGMGRIGRLALRAAMGAAHRPDDDPRRANRLEVVHLNEIKGGAEATAHLLTFDSVQGRWHARIAAQTPQSLCINDQTVGFSAHATPGQIPWGELGVDVVLECTGKFLTPETLQGHLDQGAKRVIVAAPVKTGDVLNVVMGVNHLQYNPQRDRIVTAASCTTNCLAPLVKVACLDLEAEADEENGWIRFDPDDDIQCIRPDLRSVEAPRSVSRRRNALSRDSE